MKTKSAFLCLVFYTSMARAKACVCSGRFAEGDLGTHLNQAAWWLAERGLDEDSAIDTALLNVYSALYARDGDPVEARRFLGEATRSWRSVPVGSYCLLRLPEPVNRQLNWMDPAWLPSYFGS